MTSVFDELVSAYRKQWDEVAVRMFSSAVVAGVLANSMSSGVLSAVIAELSIFGLKMVKGSPVSANFSKLDEVVAALISSFTQRVFEGLDYLPEGPFAGVIVGTYAQEMYMKFRETK